MIYENLWGSLVSFTNDAIDYLQANQPNAPQIHFIDWEAHANVQELPDTDLIGTTAFTFTEEEPGLFIGSVTIGVSTYADDQNLFRLRKYVSEICSRLRPNMKIALYDRETMTQLGWVYITNDTMVMPMTRADVRPLQFVQCHFTFEEATALVAG